jgi:hypothetical protein
MIDGRYRGTNESVSLELRVDLTELGVVSGDLHRGNKYLASVRTAPGVQATGAEGRWRAIWRYANGTAATGTLALEPGGAHDALAVTLGADGQPDWLPPPVEQRVTVHRVADLPRDLGLEVETEIGVRPPAPVASGGASMDKREALRAAGFALRDVGERTAIPHRGDGWDYSAIFTVLHDLMTATAQGSLSDPAWEVRLLMLSRSTNANLGGIMFDIAQPFRQGCAVFADAIRENVPVDKVDISIIRTTVHEIGHALNLVHRFERRVGRRDSTSYMNYPRHFADGGADAYWARFAFTFDRDELEFLRHGYQSAVMPGGARFGSVTYWAGGNGGSVPSPPELDLPGLRLTLAPPEAGPVFAFGQPVFLEVALANNTGSPLALGPSVIDPKLGALKILVRREHGRTEAVVDTVDGRPLDAALEAALDAAEPFEPMVRGCLLDELAQREPPQLPPGGVLRDNLNLTFGSGGFPFAEPGTYQVTPMLTLAVQRDGEEVPVVLIGEPLRIRIGYPHDLDEERDAMVLLRPDVGAWFALGGADSLAAAGDDLAEVAQRRHAVRGTTDPVAVTITRAAGLNAGRRCVRYRDGGFRLQDGDPARAAELLGSLDAAALRNFDRSTAAGTASLARRYAVE